MISVVKNCIRAFPAGRCRFQPSVCSFVPIVSKSSYSTVFPKNGYVHHENRKVIQIEGEKAGTLLQNLITNDLRHLSSENKSIFATFLNPQGRILYDSIIHVSKDETREAGSNLLGKSFFIECENKYLEELEAHLFKYKFRTKAKIEIMDKFNVYTVLGDVEKLSKTANIISYSPDPRHPELGQRVLIKDQPKDFLDFQKIESQDFTVKRMGLGIPEGSDFMYGKSFPLESNVDLINGVDFDKGCYLGQEMTARSKFVGTIRKRVVPMCLCTALNNENMPEQETPIYYQNTSVGKFLNGVDHIGLALVRLNSVGVNGLYMLGAGGRKISVVCETPSWVAEKIKSLD